MIVSDEHEAWIILIDRHTSASNNFASINFHINSAARPVAFRVFPDRIEIYRTAAYTHRALYQQNEHFAVTLCISASGQNCTNSVHANNALISPVRDIKLWLCRKNKFRFRYCNRKGKDNKTRVNSMLKYTKENPYKNTVFKKSTKFKKNIQPNQLNDFLVHMIEVLIFYKKSVILLAKSNRLIALSRLVSLLRQLKRLMPS